MKNPKKTWGLILLITPIPLLIVNLIINTVITFAFVGIGEGTGSDIWLVLTTIVHLLTGFVGIIAVLGIIIGMPAGIVLLIMHSSDKKPTEKST